MSSSSESESSDSDSESDAPAAKAKVGIWKSFSQKILLTQFSLGKGRSEGRVKLQRRVL